MQHVAPAGQRWPPAGGGWRGAAWQAWAALPQSGAGALQQGGDAGNNASAPTWVFGSSKLL